MATHPVVRFHMCEAHMWAPMIFATIMATKAMQASGKRIPTTKLIGSLLSESLHRNIAAP